MCKEVAAQHWQFCVPGYSETRISQYFHGIHHDTNENLKSPAKPVNASLIKKYTGVENYKGRADQIKEVMELVAAENYVDMRKWVEGRVG